MRRLKYSLKNIFKESIEEKEILLDDSNDPMDHPLVQRAITSHALKSHNGDMMAAQVSMEGELDDYINGGGHPMEFHKHIAQGFPEVVDEQPMSDQEADDLYQRGEADAIDKARGFK
jgi:hypothetical protein